MACSIVDQSQCTDFFCVVASQQNSLTSVKNRFFYANGYHFGTTNSTDHILYFKWTSTHAKLRTIVFLHALRHVKVSSFLQDAWLCSHGMFCINALTDAQTSRTWKLSGFEINETYMQEMGRDERRLWQLHLSCGWDKWISIPFVWTTVKWVLCHSLKCILDLGLTRS